MTLGKPKDRGFMTCDYCGKQSVYLTPMYHDLNKNEYGYPKEWCGCPAKIRVKIDPTEWVGITGSSGVV